MTTGAFAFPHFTPRVNKPGAGAALECHQTWQHLPKLRLRKGQLAKPSYTQCRREEAFECLQHKLMINATLCQSKTTPGAGRMPEAGHGAWHTASRAGLRLLAAGKHPGARFGTAQRAERGGMLRSGDAPSRHRTSRSCSGRCCTARAPPSRTSLPGRLGCQVPTIPGPVCFLSHPAVSSKPALGKNVSATPERPRGRSAIPAGLT